MIFRLLSTYGQVFHESSKFILVNLDWKPPSSNLTLTLWRACCTIVDALIYTRIILGTCAGALEFRWPGLRSERIDKAW